MTSPEFELVRSEPVEGPTFFGVENRWYRDANGDEHFRSVVLHPGAVAVVPFDGTHVWFVVQHRVALGRRVHEIPAGKLDVEGERPDRAAARELEEEIGQRAGRLTLLHEFLNSPGFTDERTFVYLAEDLGGVPRRPSGAEEESMSIVRMSIDDVRRLVTQPDLVDGKTLIGLYAFLRILDERPEVPHGNPR